ACTKHNITFVGPSVDAMKLMASKQHAKQCLEKTNVPLTPGYHGNTQTDKALLKAATDIGFPVLLKAASGGGGKGMRTVSQTSDFKLALAGARREAKASFGDDTMLIEKQIQHPRHVEIQLMADNHGNIVHLFERDCSIQRRHQKIIEEAPAPNLSDTLKQALADAAITVAKTIDYRGAGTVEFLVDSNQQFYFMEMNTRLQVEHPVTEMITGLDLVEWQLRIAANEVLPRKQSEITSTGHAIECRIYAEDTSQGGLPSTGTLRVFETPQSEGIRLDTGFQDNSKITHFYDPMLGKLIAYGTTREEALKRLQHALSHYVLGGLKTNLCFLSALLSHDAFKSIALNTEFLTQHVISTPTPSIEHALLFAASMTFLKHSPHANQHLSTDTFSWQMQAGLITWPLYYEIEGVRHTVHLTPVTSSQFECSYANKKYILKTSHQNNYLIIETDNVRLSAYTEVHEQHIVFHTPNGRMTVTSVDNPSNTSQSKSTQNSLNAPMPATVVAVLKNKGETVQAGDDLMVLEAMKMEHTIRAPEAGQLTEIFYPIGTQVDEGVALVRLTPIDTQKKEEA
ncbi:MAG: ATP-grasp domain-containing protein, partial [Gammaproteobacteria bacterium]|nr:ATP-grasp domain-containing protein [Gammaproteobacteria bacterium]